MFPSLQVLDQIDFEEEITFGVPSTSELPESEKGSFMDSVVTADMIQDFVQKYVYLKPPVNHDSNTAFCFFNQTIFSSLQSHLQIFPTFRQKPKRAVGFV
jgi:hypothetical protein